MGLLQLWPLITLALLGILIWSIYWYARKLLRTQRTTMRQQLQHTVEIQENERNRFANYLHDDLASLLIGVSLRMNCLEPKTERESENLTVMRSYLTDAIQRVGNIAFNLTPLSLGDRGLFFALKRFLNQCESTSSIEFEFTYEITSIVPENKALHLYRIIQELVHNGLKHSNATRIELGLYEKKGVIHMIYFDNGIGFSPERQKESKGLGLNSLKGRTEILDGNMILTTKPGKGVEYYFEIKL